MFLWSHYRLQEVQGLGRGDCWVSCKGWKQGQWRWFVHSRIAGEAHRKWEQIWGRCEGGIHRIWQGGRNQIRGYPIWVVALHTAQKIAQWRVSLSVLLASESLVLGTHEICCYPLGWVGAESLSHLLKRAPVWVASIVLKGYRSWVQGWRLDLVWSGLDFVKNLKFIGMSWNVWYVSLQVFRCMDRYGLRYIMIHVLYYLQLLSTPRGVKVFFFCDYTGRQVRSGILSHVYTRDFVCTRFLRWKCFCEGTGEGALTQQHTLRLTQHTGHGSDTLIASFQALLSKAIF